MTVGLIMRRSQRAATEELFDDFERRALAVTRCGAIQQRANRVNGLTVSPDNAANISLPKLDFENCCLTRNFGQHHVVRKFDELPNDELEKFFHANQS